MQTVTDLLNAIAKFPTQLLLAIALASGALLFLPQPVAESLGIDDFRNEYRVFIGPVFLLAAVWLTVRFLALVGGAIVDPIVRWKNTRALRKRLLALTPEEKGYLAAFVIERENTVYVGLDDGVMGGLEARKIVFRAANQGSLIDGFAFNLQPWAREYLTENPHLLDGAEGQPLTPGEKLRGQW